MTCRRVKRKIMQEIASIKDGYEIIEREQDGCDMDGWKYWVWCKNGFSARDWEVDSECNKAIANYKKYRFEDGIPYNGTIYYMKKEVIDNSINRNYKVPFISKEEYARLYSNTNISL